MSRTSINISAVFEAKSQIDSAKNKVSSAKNSFTQTNSVIDGKIKERYNISVRGSSIQRRLNNIDNKIRQINETVHSSANWYLSTDDTIRNWEKELKKRFAVDAVSPFSSIWASYFDNNEIVDLYNKSILNELLKYNKLKDYISRFKPHAVTDIMFLCSPITTITYIMSGVLFSDRPLYLDPTRTPKATATADWLGYEVDDDKLGITAWLGKASASAQNESGYAGVNAYLGKANGEIDADFSFMKTKKEKEFVDGEWVEKSKTEYINAEVGASAAVSAIAVDGEAGVGSDMLGIGVAGEGSVGNAEAEGKVKFSVTDEGVNLNASGKALVSAAEGEVKGTINIFGLEITTKVVGYAGAVGVEGKVGIEDNKFVCEGGAAALFGISGGVEIGFNQTGWSDFVDFITFWD